MKNIYILLLILFVSCQQKAENKLIRLDLSKKKFFLGKRQCCNDEYMIFEFQNRNNSLEGKMTHIKFIKDSRSTINGTIKDSIIEFTYKERGIKKPTARGIIRNNQVKITLNDCLKLTLEEIDSSIYNKKYLKAYDKLTTLKKDTIIGNYLFEIKIKNWNSKTHYGNSTITIKDKTTKEEIQQIKSDQFYFHSKDELFFDYQEDYNFDNNNDLSFSTGRGGPYGTYSSDYYIYDKVEKKFIRNLEFEDIANSLSFTLDKTKKRMIEVNRGSCCMHETNAYKWKNDKIELVKSLFVDRTDMHEHGVILKKRVHGKLKTIIDKPYPSFTDKEINKLYERF